MTREGEVSKGTKRYFDNYSKNYEKIQLFVATTKPMLPYNVVIPLNSTICWETEM